MFENDPDNFIDVTVGGAAALVDDGFEPAQAASCHPERAKRVEGSRAVSAGEQEEASMLPKLDERGYAGLADMVGSRAAAGMLDSSDAAEEASEILEEAQYTPGIEPADIPQEVLEELMPGDEVVVLPRVELARKPFYDFAKRAFDFVACSLALILLAIPMVVIACKVKLDSPGPAIYAQRRVGRGGRVFEMYKFRSMYLDAEANGARWAVGDDPRVTPFGRFMRRTRLDELPQFWNVIKGDMSLIGPRPERPAFAEEFEKRIVGFNQRALVRPGLSGLAQVTGGYELLPKNKVMYDLEYIENRGLLLDAKIMAKTVAIIFTGNGAR